MSDDMSQFMGVFLDEVTEQLELLERDILVLEQDASEHLLQEIFRAAHTLKGSSRAMGFTAMGELTHAMEDIFDRLRHETISVSRELIDALFDGLDSLKAMKEEIASVGTTGVESSKQTARLRSVLLADLESSVEALSESDCVRAKTGSGSGETFCALTETQQDAIQAARSAGCKMFHIRVTLAPDCIMKSVRALMVLQALEQVGSVLALSPDEEALENEDFESAFELLIASEAAGDTLQRTAGGVTEIRDAICKEWPLSPASAPDKERAASSCRRSIIGNEPVMSIEERVINAGPQARGMPPEEVQKLAIDTRTAVQSQTVRVDVARLDNLLNLVGELVIDRTRIAQLVGQFEGRFAACELIENLQETAGHIARITNELQAEIMRARMLPIDNVFSRFPRMMRDLAQKLEKELNFAVEGGETELDRSVIEVIGDPLIHMLRNSIDHGIESPLDRENAGKPRVGNVRLRARHEENHIVIEIQDDGRGIDPNRLRKSAVRKGLIAQEAAARLTDKEAMNLIFAAGFSTVDTVSEISGRGVGMDIVKSNLERLGATIDIQSTPGAGSIFTIKLPLTLAIIRALLVRVSGNVYALPLVSVVETLKIVEQDLHAINHREVVLQRGRTLPVIRLRDMFYLGAAVTSMEDTRMDKQRANRQRDNHSSIDAGMSARSETAPTPAEHHYLVVVGLAHKQVGLIVDSLIGEQEVVIKSLGKFIGDIQGISGATIMGDGRVALIVDVNGIIQIALAEKGKAYAA